MATKKKTVKKTEIKATEPVKASPSKADVLWDKIKGLSLELYGLPGQTLENNSKRHNMGPDDIYLELKSSAVLPALEEALVQVRVGKYEMIDVSQVDKYTVIKVILKNQSLPFVRQTPPSD